MQQNALVTGADRGLGLALTMGLLDTGWRVFAGQYKADWPELGELAARHAESLTIIPLDVSSQASALEAARLTGEHTNALDLLISNAGVNSPVRTATIREKQDYDEMHRLYDTNSLGALRMVEAFLPLMEKSAMKRLCFVSSEAGSIARAKRRAWFSYCMSKAALNMGVQLLFNDLRPCGYTFRLYHPGGIRSYIGGTDVKGTKARMEPGDAAKPALNYFVNDLSAAEEGRLVMRDWKGDEWPW